MTRALYDWTKEAVAALRKEWKKGTSASEIMHKLPMDAAGLLPSRNAIIGKSHRLGLERRGNKHPPQVSTKPRKKYTYHNRFTVGPAPEKFEPKMISLLDLNLDTCRWPMWPEFSKQYHYCGLKPKDDSVYCPTHSKEAFGRKPEWVVQPLRLWR